MKRIVVITLALILMVSSALASSLDSLIEEYNIGCLASGAEQITGNPEISNELIIYSITDNVKVNFSMDGDSFKSFSVVCMDDSETALFLAQIVSAFYMLGGIEAYVSCYGPVLMNFLSARSGSMTGSDPSVDGLLFKITKSDYGYTFIVVKV